MTVVCVGGRAVLNFLGFGDRQAPLTVVCVGDRAVLNFWVLGTGRPLRCKPGDSNVFCCAFGSGGV